MNVELSQMEMDNLVSRVTEKIRDQFTSKVMTDKIYDDAKKMAVNLVKIHRPEIEAKFQAIDLLKPIVVKILKDDNLLVDVLKSAVNEYFSTTEFKKISIEMLRRRINHIQDEIDVENSEY